MLIFPGDAIQIAYTAVMILPHPCMDGGSGSDAARAGAVGAVKGCTGGGQCIKIWRFYIRMTCISQTVPAKLVGHKKYNIGTAHKKTPLFFYHHNIIKIKKQESARKIVVQTVDKRRQMKFFIINMLQKIAKNIKNKTIY